jgi:hypothetical protein
MGITNPEKPNENAVKKKKVDKGDMKKHLRKGESKKYTIVFYPNDNSITFFEVEYVDTKEPNNGVIQKFAKRNGISYKYWGLKK